MWADAYVGLPAEGRWPCWNLVRKVWQERLNFVMPSFDGETQSSAIKLGTVDFVDVPLGEEKPFDGVLTYTGDPSIARGRNHIGVVVKKGLFLHVHEFECSIIVPIKSIRPIRIIRGPWKLQDES